MILKDSPFSIQNKSIRKIDNKTKEYPTLNDLIKDQDVINKKGNAVHYRRDLDSLG